MLHRLGIRFILCLLLGSFPAWAQTTNLTPLYSFDGGANGGSPAGLTLGNDGNFYGVTQVGGATGRGTIYRTNSGGGLLTTLYSFQVADVGNPIGLIQTANGDLYGVTSGNVSSNIGGTFFKYVPSTNSFTTVFRFSFQDTNGAVPNPDLALDSAGTIYGTTQAGGNTSLNCASQSCGTVFKYVPSTGTFSTLYRFSGGANGANPKAGLALASDGNFYGTATVGGSNGAGTTFRITTGGTLTTTLSLAGGLSGFNPSAPLLQGTDGFLYGTTLAAVPGFGDSGVVFQTATSGSSYAVVYPFSGSGQDGAGPNTRLVQSTDPDSRVTGQLYGTTNGSFSQCPSGTVYKIPTFGQEVTLHCFTGGNDGLLPTSNLIQGSDKNFYGTASGGGANGNGVLYKLVDPKLPNPIISSITPTTAGAGSQLTITGTGLSLVNKITFTGLSGGITVPATVFRVVSDTQIQVTVPLGAVSGSIRLESFTSSAYAAASSPSALTITPSITNISPVRGPVGARVNIVGSGLAGTTSVRFNGTSASFFVNNDFLIPFPGVITATVPAGATSGSITLTTASGTATSPISFTVGTASPLRITSVDTLSGPVGTTLTLGGTGFTGTTSVTFSNNVPATFTVLSDTLITVTVPVGAITGPITVSTSTNTTTSSGYFQVTAPVPTITSLSQTSGPIGTTLTITGTGLSATNSVRIGTVVGSFTANSDTSLSFTIPVGALPGAGVITVTTPSGAPTANFTVTSGAPTITGFTPNRANFGATVVLTGSGFTGATSVTFNGLTTSFTVNSDTQITTSVPPGAISGPIQVTTSGGAINSTNFIVNPVAVRTSGWQQSGTGDFNGDGKPDLLWRNYTTGANRVWFMNGGAYIGEADFVPVTDTFWQLIGATDFTGDGKPDLIWRNFSTGENAIWQMNGTTFVQSASLPSQADSNWQLAGVGDLTADGQPDLIWRNFGTGDVYLWQMNGTSFAQAFFIGPVTDPYWQMTGVGDLTKDGKPDLIWRYWGPTGPYSGQIYVWQMGGYTYEQAFYIGPVTDFNFQLTGVADFTNDGLPDLVWSNNFSNDNYVWQMDGYTYRAAYFIGFKPTP